MSDQQNTPAPDQPGADSGSEPIAFDADYVQKLRQEAAKYRTEAKANHAKLQELEPLAKKAQELEDAAKSDPEKLTEKFNEANARAAALEGEKNRLAVIAKHGIPEEFQDLVQGSDAESLSASAEKVRAVRGERWELPPPGLPMKQRSSPGGSGLGGRCGRGSGRGGAGRVSGRGW